MKEILRKPGMKVGIYLWGTETWTITFFDDSTFKNKNILKFKSKLVYKNRTSIYFVLTKHK